MFATYAEISFFGKSHPGQLSVGNWRPLNFLRNSHQKSDATTNLQLSVKLSVKVLEKLAQVVFELDPIPLDTSIKPFIIRPLDGRLSSNPTTGSINRIKGGMRIRGWLKIEQYDQDDVLVNVTGQYSAANSNSMTTLSKGVRRL